MKDIDKITSSEVDSKIGGIIALRELREAIKLKDEEIFINAEKELENVDPETISETRRIASDMGEVGVIRDGNGMETEIGEYIDAIPNLSDKNTLIDENGDSIRLIIPSEKNMIENHENSLLDTFNRLLGDIDHELVTTLHDHKNALNNLSREMYGMSYEEAKIAGCDFSDSKIFDTLYKMNISIFREIIPEEIVNRLYQKSAVIVLANSKRVTEPRVWRDIINTFSVEFVLYDSLYSDEEMLTKYTDAIYKTSTIIDLINKEMGTLVKTKSEITNKEIIRHILDSKKKLGIQNTADVSVDLNWTQINVYSLMEQIYQEKIEEYKDNEIIKEALEEQVYAVQRIKKAYYLASDSEFLVRFGINYFKSLEDSGSKNHKNRPPINVKVIKDFFDDLAKTKIKIQLPGYKAEFGNSTNKTITAIFEKFESDIKVLNERYKDDPTYTNINDETIPIVSRILFICLVRMTKKLCKGEIEYADAIVITKAFYTYSTLDCNLDIFRKMIGLLTKNE